MKLVALGRQPWPLFVYGPAGSGKTSGALALCDCVDSALFTTMEIVADTVMGNGPTTAKNLWSAVDEVDLAVLDEVGLRADGKDLHYTSAKKFADMRQGRPTIYISNVQPQNLSRLYDDRISSRLLCGSVVHVDGQDRRRTG